MADNTIPVGAPYGQQIISVLDINEPEIHRSLYRPYWNEVKEYLFVRALGFDSPAASETVSHFEADKSHVAFKVGAHNAGASAGASVELTLDASSKDDSGRFYPRVRDIVTFKGNAKIQAAITAINTSTGTVTVTPIKSSVTIPAVLEGETIIITSGVAGEGSNTVAPAFARFTKHNYQLQIIKESVMSSGSSLTDQTYIDILNSAGEFQGVYSEAFVEGEQRMMLKINGALLTGQQNTYATAPDDPTESTFGGKLLTSQGVLTTAESLGTDVQVSAFNSMDDFDTLTTSLVKQYVSTATPVWMGMGLGLKLDLDNFLQGTAFVKEDQQYLNKVASDRLGTALDVTIDFDKVKKTYIYMLDTVMAFSNPETYGATGYSFDTLGIGIPLGKQKDPTSKTGEKYATFGMRYKSMGAYNRRFESKPMAGFGATLKGEQPVHGYDYRTHEWMSHQGAQFMNANSFLYLY